MNPISVATLASVFTIGGAVVGLPSLMVLGLYALHTVSRRLAAPRSETNFGESPDAVLWMLKGMSQLLGAVAHIVGSLVQAVLDIAALAAGAGLVLGLACWLTGRGLHADATWARVSASALLTLAMLLALLLALSLRGIGRVPPLALVVLAALGLHALWFGARPALS